MATQATQLDNTARLEEADGKFLVYDSENNVRVETENREEAVAALENWRLTDSEWLAEVCKLRPMLWLSMGGSNAEPPYPVYHPFLHMPFGARYNSPAELAKWLEDKERFAEEKLAEHNYAGYVFLGEKPYRAQLFQKVASAMADADYWKTLAEVYTNSENTNQHKEVWRKLFESRRPGKENFMDEAEREFFNALPQRITVYRGYHPHAENWLGKERRVCNKKGRSWSLSYDIALTFTHRIHGAALGDPKPEFVRKLTVNKAECLGYLSGRREQEIVFAKAR